MKSKSVLSATKNGHLSLLSSSYNATVTILTASNASKSGLRPSKEIMSDNQNVVCVIPRLNLSENEIRK